MLIKLQPCSFVVNSIKTTIRNLADFLFVFNGGFEIETCIAYKAQLLSLRINNWNEKDCIFWFPHQIKEKNI